MSSKDKIQQTNTDVTALTTTVAAHTVTLASHTSSITALNTLSATVNAGPFSATGLYAAGGAVSVEIKRYPGTRFAKVTLNGATGTLTATGTSARALYTLSGAANIFDTNANYNFPVVITVDGTKTVRCNAAWGAFSFLILDLVIVDGVNVLPAGIPATINAGAAGAWSHSLVVMTVS